MFTARQPHIHSTAHSQHARRLRSVPLGRVNRTPSHLRQFATTHSFMARSHHTPGTLASLLSSSSCSLRLVDESMAEGFHWTSYICQAVAPPAPATSGPVLSERGGFVIVGPCTFGVSLSLTVVLGHGLGLFPPCIVFAYTCLAVRRCLGLDVPFPVCRYALVAGCF